MKKIYFYIFLILVFCTCLLLFPSSSNMASPPLYTYISSSGVRFTSYVSNWNEQDLKALEQDFFSNNTFGSELATLQEVRLVPGGSEDTLGETEIAIKRKYIFFGKREFLPKRTITIYHAETYHPHNIKLNFILSHEYGHIFTYYWIISSENKNPRDQTTKWATIRNLYPSHFPIRWSTSHLPYDHYWQPEEIMADDYALLFGFGRLKPEIMPFENKEVPFAPEIKGLRTYWESISDIKTSPTY